MKTISQLKAQRARLLDRLAQIDAEIAAMRQPSTTGGDGCYTRAPYRVGVWIAHTPNKWGLPWCGSHAEVVKTLPGGQVEACRACKKLEVTR